MKEAIEIAETKDSATNNCTNIAPIQFSWDWVTLNCLNCQSTDCTIFMDLCVWLSL